MLNNLILYENVVSEFVPGKDMNLLATLCKYKSNTYIDFFFKELNIIQFILEFSFCFIIKRPKT